MMMISMENPPPNAPPSSSSSTARLLPPICLREVPRDTTAVIQAAVALVDAGRSLYDPVTFVDDHATEPLMHALARRMRAELCQALRHTAEAMGQGVFDVERPNALGDTPLYLALRNRLLGGGGDDEDETDYMRHAVLRGDVHLYMECIGGSLTTPLIQHTLPRRCIEEGRVAELFPLVDAMGARGTPPPPGLLHQLVAGAALGGAPVEPRHVQRLLDEYGYSALARDAEGRTALDLVLRRGAAQQEEEEFDTTELAEVLRDAIEEAAPEVCLALAMGMAHARLGEASPLRHLDAELLRAFVLPALARPANVAQARTARLAALAEAEGLVVHVAPTLRDDYVFGGAPFVPALFRRAHFFSREIPAQHHLAWARVALERRGLFFTEPLTPAYIARARRAVEGMHPRPPPSAF